MCCIRAVPSLIERKIFISVFRIFSRSSFSPFICITYNFNKNSKIRMVPLKCIFRKECQKKCKVLLKTTNMIQYSIDHFNDGLIFYHHKELEEVPIPTNSRGIYQSKILTLISLYRGHFF